MNNKMKILSVFFAINLSMAALAGEYFLESSIYDVEKDFDSKDYLQVLAEADGQVYQLKKSDENLVAIIKDAINSNNVLNLVVKSNDEVDANAINEIVGINTISNEITTSSFMDFDSIENDDYKGPLENYTPTVLTSMTQAQELFDFLDAYAAKRRSQCFNRAHVWSYEIDVKKGVKTKKNFIFYTQKYRKQINKKWWFHVAPTVVVNNEDIFLDWTFTDEPMNRNAWEGIFVKPLKKRLGETFNCEKIDRMSTYRNRTTTDWCFHLETSMYYWGPLQIDYLEMNKEKKLEWDMGELNAARREAFGKRSW